MKNHSMICSLIRVIKLTLGAFILSAVLLGCVSNSTKQSGPTMNIDPRLLKGSPDDLAFWMTFAIAKQICGKDYPTFSYSEFFCAFKLASLAHTKKEEHEKPKSEFLIAIKKIVEADFIDEYIFHYYRHEIWFQEPNLKTESFIKWMDNNLVDHEAGNYRGISIEQPEIIIDESGIPKIHLSQNFETSIGNLLYINQKRYEKPSLGLSLRYQVVSREDGWLDFYIYPKRRTDEGVLKENSLVDEASITKSAIIYYAQKDKAESMQVLEETSNLDVSFLKGRYEIVRDGATYIDELYISGNEKYFLKARSTYHKGHQAYTDSEIKIIFDSLLASVK